MTTRAVSNPVGIVLILGMTVLSVGALVAVGGAVIDDTRADAERSQMENSMSAFSSKASLVGLGQSGHQRFSLGRVSQGQVDVREDAGNVRIWVERSDCEDDDCEIANTSMGAVVYENDGREIAYQGGGVWARQDDFSRMLSPPEFHYRGETLTFPIINVTGNGAASGDVRGAVSSEKESQRLYPDGSPLTNPLSNGTVYVEIESEYCNGWQSFFEGRMQESPREECGEDDTVKIALDASLSPVFGAAITSDKDTSNDNPDVENHREGIDPPPADSEIESRVGECSEWGSIESPVSAGTHCTEDPDEFRDLTIDTTDGDVGIIINDVDNDGITDTGDIDIEGDGTVEVYLNSSGGIDISGNNEININGDPEQFIIYVHSDSKEIKLSGTVDYAGGIYAPNATLDKGGNITVEGSIVVREFGITNKGATFNHAESMNDITPELGTDLVNYVHVSERSVKVELG